MPITATKYKMMTPDRRGQGSSIAIGGEPQTQLAYWRASSLSYIAGLLVIDETEQRAPMIEAVALWTSSPEPVMAL